MSSTTSQYSADIDSSPLFADLVQFIRKECGVRPEEPISLKTRINHDLGVGGDDGDEFMQHLMDRFGLSRQYVEQRVGARDFFGPEGTSLAVLILPIHLGLKALGLRGLWNELPPLTVRELLQWIMDAPVVACDDS